MILEQILEEPLFLNNREDNTTQHNKNWNGERLTIRCGRYVNPKTQMGVFANGGCVNADEREEKLFGKSSTLIIPLHKEPQAYYTPPTTTIEQKKVEIIDMHDTYKVDRYGNPYSQHTTITVVNNEQNTYHQMRIDLAKEALNFKLNDSLVGKSHCQLLLDARKKR